MSDVIAFTNQKGGVGKTTLSLNVAGELAKLNDTLLIDADPQGSAMDWYDIREQPHSFDVIGMPKPIIHKQIKRLSRNYRFIIIDGPPRMDAITRSILMAATIAVVPVQPSALDVRATDDTVQLIHEASVFNEILKSVFVVNRAMPHTRVARTIADDLALLNLPILNTVIGQHVALAESKRHGGLVCELEPKGKAQRNIESLCVELGALAYGQ